MGAAVVRSVGGDSAAAAVVQHLAKGVLCAECCVLCAVC